MEDCRLLASFIPQFPFMKSTVWLCSSCLKFVVLLFLISATAAGQKKSPPNIIYILADDLGYGDIGCYGQQKIKTPNIDRLAAQGKKFSSFYAGSTVCAPSRAALMTGLHTGHVSVRGNGEFPLPAEEKIISEYLKEAGYTTGMMGKWGLGLPNTTGTPELRGWDYFSGFVHHVEGHFQHPDSAWKIEDRQLKKIEIPEDQFANEWFANEGISFIEKEKGNPFFLYLAFTLPHAELLAPEQFMKPYLTEGESIFAPEQPHPTGQHYGPQPFPKAAYAAMVSQMDYYVGQVMETIKAAGLDDNTIFIFTSDNGTHQEGGRSLQDALAYFESSGPFRGIKRNLYEGGIRVPFIVRWPGNIEAGSSTDIPAANWDLLSTFTAIAGMKAPASDGVSLAPLLLDKVSGSALKKLQKRVFYWEFYEQGYKQAVRMGKWKAIRYYRATEPVRTELYNLEQDIKEQQELSSQYPAIVKMMEKTMDKERKRSVNPAFQIR